MTFRYVSIAVGVGISAFWLANCSDVKFQRNQKTYRLSDQPLFGEPIASSGDSGGASSTDDSGGASSSGDSGGASSVGDSGGASSGGDSGGATSGEEKASVCKNNENYLSMSVRGISDQFAFNGHCWHLAIPRMSCNERCRDHGGFDLAAAQEIANPSRPDLCRSLLEAYEAATIAVSEPFYFDTRLMNEVPGQGGLGCFFIDLHLASHLNPAFGHPVFIGTGSPVHGDSTGYPRACSCNE